MHERCCERKYCLSFDLVDRLFAKRIHSVVGLPSPVKIDTTSPFFST